MMRHTFALPALLALIVSATNLVQPAVAGDDDAVKGSGHIATETRDLAEFDEVEVRIAADTHIVVEKQAPLIVEADDNLIPLITTEVKNRRLIISSEQNYKCKKTPKITIMVSDLKAAEVKGSGDLRIDGVSNDALSLSIAGSGDMVASGESKNLSMAVAGSGDMAAAFKAEHVSASVSGAGDMKLTGSADELTASVVGSGDIHAYKMPAKTATVNVQGAGDVRVHAIETLTVQIMGSGDVHYEGSPTVTQKITGSGEVKRHD